ncbi:unnamed protein product [Callosobruchus maculatus]|uniref:Uncharacterized protein n=1 Tax=Callosobruchus maculatus TaxID=64391 RepID=A0A653D1S9_CALMS|nr:unnamed protein product [Callosobruchus maculatus]
MSRVAARIILLTIFIVLVTVVQAKPTPDPNPFFVAGVWPYGFSWSYAAPPYPYYPYYSVRYRIVV